MEKIMVILLWCALLGYAGGAGAQDRGLIPDDRLVVAGFEISGNKITKDHIIIREIVLEKGDTVMKLDLIPTLQRSKVNLLNTSLFNFVHLDVEHLSGGRIIIKTRVTERWYIWPVPILEYAERNFSEFIKNKEWDKLVYGAYLKWNNFRGRNELLTAKIRLGYINEYALAYHIPNLGRKQQHAVSNGFNLNHQNEVNVRTVYNMPQEFKPEETPAQVQINAFSKYTYRPKYFSTHTLRLDYTQYQISNAVMLANPNYLGTDLVHGEPLNELRYFTLSYRFVHDVRDSKVYPLDGFMVKLTAEQVGLGFVTDFPYPMLKLSGVLMFHETLSSRFFFYNTTKIMYSTEKVLPHVMNKGLGYHEFLTAYEPYVMDGSDYIISLYNLKFQLVKPTTKTLPLIGMEQFNKIHYAVYINLFANAGYVNNEFPNPTNTMVNTLQYSAGIGVDLVTYYDQVFRIDFSINRYGEYGVFFHLETPFSRW